MRIAILLTCSFVLSGCGAAVERAIGTQTIVSQFRANLGAENLDLRAALARDIAIKNAELEYVSAGGYSCGPNRADFAPLRQLDFRRPTPKARAERIKRRIAYLKTTYGDLATILEYGDKLDQIIKDQAAAVETLEATSTLLTSANEMVPDQFKPVLATLKNIAKIAGAINHQYYRVQLINLAKTNHESLVTARDRIIRNRVHKRMTDLERRAFYNWESCAIDRLAFLREYRPGELRLLSGKPADLLRRTSGESTSTTLEFVALYRRYLEEKEAFVGQLADYAADINAIVDANEKIANFTSEATVADFINALNEAVVDGNTVRTNYRAVRENLTSH